jgi:hypothetical protein
MPRVKPLITEKVEIMIETKEVIRTEQERKETQTTRQRIPFGVPRQKLHVNGEIPGYHLYIVNDAPGRIDAALQGGYDFVTAGEVQIDDRVVPSNKDLGSKIKWLVGTNEDNSPLYAYLMKIKQEFYEEDQKALEELNNRTDEAIKRGSIEGGSANRYDAGINISRK